MVNDIARETPPFVYISCHPLDLLFARSEATILDDFFFFWQVNGHEASLDNIIDDGCTLWDYLYKRTKAVYVCLFTHYTFLVNEKGSYETLIQYLGAPYC